MREARGAGLANLARSATWGRRREGWLVPGVQYDLVHALEDIERERGIEKGVLLSAVEQALVAAYRRHYGTNENVVARLDRDLGQFRLFVQKRVVEEVEDPDAEIALAEARELHPGYEVGDVVEREVDTSLFGRIAAQTAKQVVLQRLREAERDMIYDEFIQREGDIITATVERVQGRHVFVDLGRTEAVMGPADLIPGEYYRPGERIKVFLAEVRRTPRGPQIVISRSHPDLVKRLFELEVPEIHDGVVEIVGIAREAGARTKIAVRSRDPNVDPVGACVGQRGMRVQAVVNELHGEKIDIIRWSEEPAEFIANALSPARVTQVELEESGEERVARVVVPDHQLSLAIGRAGQNARLAARLTGWKVDIRSEGQVTEEAMRAALTGEAVSEGPLPAWFQRRPAGRVSDVWEQAWQEALRRRAGRFTREEAVQDGETERRWEDEEDA